MLSFCSNTETRKLKFENAVNLLIFIYTIKFKWMKALISHL